MFLLGEAQLFKFPQREKILGHIYAKVNINLGTKKSSLFSTEYLEIWPNRIEWLHFIDFSSLIQ